MAAFFCLYPPEDWCFVFYESRFFDSFTNAADVDLNSFLYFYL